MTLKMFKYMFILSNEQIEAIPEWLPIEGFPKYEVNCREGLVRNVRTLRVLKANDNGNGYPFGVLSKDGKKFPKNVHRIVANAAFAYYGIQTDGLLVMHLDEERHNPMISNLALGTNKENLNFPKAKQRYSQANKGKRRSAETIKKLSKRVGAYENGRLIMTFESTQEAGRNGFSQGCVSECCLGNRKNHKGYTWRYLTA